MAKTQAQINARMKAYYNKTVDSPYRIKTLTYREPGYAAMQPGSIDVDFRFNSQCMDLIIDYVLWYTDNKVRTWGNARDIVDNKLEPYFTWHKNTPGYVPPKGAIGVATFGTPGFEKYGHIWIVYDKANKNTMRVLEQNWDNLANKGPMLRTDNYYGCAGFWVPNVAKSTVKDKVKEVVKKVTPTKKVKAKKILIVAGHGGNDPGAGKFGENERDFIRKNITPQVAKLLRSQGHKVELYGGTKQNQNLFADTAYGDRVGDSKNYGMYWAKQQKFDVIVEFHLDAAGASASGGHVIISSAFKADDIDKNLDKALRNSVGTIRPIDPRNNLLNANVSAKLNMNYRLVELGFITSKKDMDYIKKNLNSFNKSIAEAIGGGAIAGGSVSKPVSKPSTPKPKPKPVNHAGYKTNKYGTVYKAEKGRFTNGGQPISNRLIGPFLNQPIGYSFNPGGYCDYNYVLWQDNHVWIEYDWKGKTYYLPVRKYNGVHPAESGYKSYEAWGKFS